MTADPHVKRHAEADQTARRSPSRSAEHAEDTPISTPRSVADPRCQFIPYRRLDGARRYHRSRLDPQSDLTVIPEPDLEPTS
jgi:hypothetical protein